MFDTDEPVKVNLCCHKSMMKYLIDRFGRDVRITSMQEVESALADSEIQREKYPAGTE